MHQIPSCAGLRARLAARRGTPLAPIDWAVLEAKAQRQERAAIAQRTARRRPPTQRAVLPAPRYTRQYAQALSTLPAHDGRLADGAVRLLHLIRALAGDDGELVTTKASLAAGLPAPDGRGRSVSTVRRHLAALKAGGYITVAIKFDEIGATSGLRVTLTELAKPFYESKDHAAAYEAAAKNQDFQGVPLLLPIKGQQKQDKAACRAPALVQKGCPGAMRRPQLPQGAPPTG